MLSEQARDYIRGLSDGALAEYLRADIEMYDPEAVAFARQEFEHRRIDPQAAAQLEVDNAARTDRESARRGEVATRPLDWAAKVLAFAGGFFAFPLIPMIIVWLRFRERGEHRKSREMWMLAAFGVVAAFAIGTAWEVAQLLSR